MKLHFDNRTLERLPVESSGDYLVQRPIPNACFSQVEPTPIAAPQLVALSSEALALIGVKSSDVDADDEFLAQMSGNEKIDGARYAAHCYCGHQFGNFAGQLGDGATMYIGEVMHNEKRVELQFKGAGKTPFSRTADGRKVLRSSIREFLCSEAMAGLGVPTTRAGTLVTSFETRVARDKNYDGNNKQEPTAVITRLAETFLRFGSFEIAKLPDQKTGRAGPSAGNNELVTQLLDFTIDAYYPELANTEQKYKNFLSEITKRTARLASQWQMVGFCHGVLNTDNMSIVGLTLDYGPFGFMDRFDPDHICNATDTEGRYKYANQPLICKWNLMKFAQQIQHALDFDSMQEIAEFITQHYDVAYVEAITTGVRRKLGLTKEDDGDMALYEMMMTAMKDTGADFTATWRALELIETDDKRNITETSKTIFLDHVVSSCCYGPEAWKKSANAVEDKEIKMMKMMLQHGMLDENDEIRCKAMIEENERKLDKFNITPCSKMEADRVKWAEFVELYAIRLRAEDDLAGRVKLLRETNPKYILRNHIAEKVIASAEEGDFEPVRRVHRLLTDPFTEQDGFDDYARMTPMDDIVTKLT